MRVLAVNALRATGKLTGVGRHIELLIQQWSRLSLPFQKIVVHAPQAPHIADLGSETPVEIRVCNQRYPNLFWEQVVLPIAARDADLLFCPGYNCPLFYPGKIVLANHGIGPPGSFNWISELRSRPINHLSARRADHVIANSTFTSVSLQKFFQVDASRISIVKLAANDVYFQTYSPTEIDAEVCRVLGGQYPYIIFVGKLSARRNVPNLIRAFAHLRRELQLPHKLLIVGPNSSEVPLAEIVAAENVTSAVCYVPFIEALPLAKLYAGAELFVLPTTVEGFSLTILEAMASGTAVLTVEHPALSEGAAEAAFALPTASIDDLVRGLKLLLTDHSLRSAYQQRGREKARQFTGLKTAEATMEILSRIAFPHEFSGSGQNSTGREAASTEGR